MEHLQHQQQGIEEPPGWVRADDGPALKQSGVQDPGRKDKLSTAGIVYMIFN